MAEAMLTYGPDDPVIIQHRPTLNLCEVLDLFQSNETVGSIPFRPKGGQIFVFKPGVPSKKNDWKADGHS